MCNKVIAVSGNILNLLVDFTNTMHPIMVVMPASYAILWETHILLCKLKIGHLYFLNRISNE